MGDLSTQASGRVFLSAEWRDLVMLNYQVDAALLREYVPKGTELDVFNGIAFISLVGFRFLRARLMGALHAPFHSDFDEVNLRFYVKRYEGEECRRGVSFIREIVPKRLIVRIARLVYGENYSCYPMRHQLTANETGKVAEYEWAVQRKWNKIHARTSGVPVLPEEGSVEKFISEHYWGYSGRRGARTLEYRVSHLPWRVWTSTEAGFEGEGVSTYGEALGRVLSRKPDSAFIAEGSPVLIYMGKPILAAPSLTKAD